MRRVLIVFATIALLMVGLVPAASAGGDADCTDFPLEEFPPGEGPPFPIHLVIGEVIDGNLTVPPNVGCVLIGTTVNGDVDVVEGAVFTDIVEGSTVNGNVEIGKEAGSFLFGSSVDGNVLVGEGAVSALEQSVVTGDFICDHCFFEDVIESTVEGNVQIKGEEDGSWLIDSTIGGNIQIEDSGVIDIAFWAQGTSVEGNIEISGSKGPIYLFDNSVEGNISIVDNKIKKSGLFPGPIPVFEDEEAGEVFPIFPWIDRDTKKKAELIGNTVGGNLEFKDNRGGKALISDNVIEGNLTCDGNKKKPKGSGNIADEKEGQCSNL